MVSLPIKYIEGCRTPTLFVHSDQDYRCNIAEGMEMFAALKVLGVDTRMLVVKGRPMSCPGPEGPETGLCA